MENGEWRMENGEWRMENGEWRMENGELRILRESLERCLTGCDEKMVCVGFLGRGVTGPVFE